LTPSTARRVLLVLLIVALMAGVILLVRSRSSQTIISTAAGVHLPVESQAARHSPAPNPPQLAKDHDTVELCGYGRISRDSQDPGAAYRQLGTLTSPIAARWIAALQNSGDLRSRAAGLLLEGKVTDGESLLPVAAQTRDAAVQLAAGTSDPAVYALVLAMCAKDSGNDADNACRQLSLQGWTRIDPDNALPWLLLAANARVSHDDAAEVDAFSHAAKAHKVDAYSDSLFAFSAPELPQDLTPLARAYFATEVIGIEAAVGAPQYGIATQHCSREDMQDSNVRQQCASVAELLVRKGPTLLDLGVGRIIGARAGWPSDRVNGLLQEQHALMQAIVQVTPSDDNDRLWTCETVSQLNAYMVQRVRLGEIGAAREALERSGESIETMAQKYDQYIDSIRRDALSQAPNSAPTTQ
jgi:hypothetical protein